MVKNPSTHQADRDVTWYRRLVAPLEGEDEAMVGAVVSEGVEAGREGLLIFGVDSEPPEQPTCTTLFGDICTTEDQQNSKDNRQCSQHVTPRFRGFLNQDWIIVSVFKTESAHIYWWLFRLQVVRQCCTPASNGFVREQSTGMITPLQQWWRSQRPSLENLPVEVPSPLSTSPLPQHWIVLSGEHRKADWFQQR